MTSQRKEALSTLTLQNLCIYIIDIINIKQIQHGIKSGCEIVTLVRKDRKKQAALRIFAKSH